AVLPTSAEFRAMLRPHPPRDPALADRWWSLRPALARLWLAGIRPSTLQLAWDFTVASTDNTTGRAVHMRDEAFATLGEAAPTVTVTSVEDPTPQQDPFFQRKI